MRGSDGGVRSRRLWVVFGEIANIEIHLQLTFGCEGGGVVAGMRTRNHLQLTSECEGGGVVAGPLKKLKKTPLQLAFGWDGGGSGGKRVEMSKKSTSGSHLDGREVVVVANTSNWFTSGAHSSNNR